MRIPLLSALLALASACECSAPAPPAPSTPPPTGLTPTAAPAMEPNRAPLAELYPVHFPDELYAIWELAQRLRPDAPRSAFDAVGVNLCGPFDLLAGERRDEALALPMLLHWRFFLDPPEFFTVATGDTDGLHWGYWFDEAHQASGVAHYYSRDAYEIAADGSTLTAALVARIDHSIESSHENSRDDAAHADTYQRQIEAAMALRAALIDAATQRHEWPAPQLARRANVPTSDGMGIVVPAPTLSDTAVDARATYARADQGEGAALVAEATAALDHGHPGLALLLARPAWTAAACEADHEAAAEVMARAYSMLGREGLAFVTRTHEEHRGRRDVDITVGP